MSDLSPEQSKLLTYIKKMTPFSMIELGMRFAGNGYVTDCSRSANTISGVVRDDQNAEFAVRLVMVSSQSTEVHCSCSSSEELAEQWCQHTVALLWRASELGFLEARSGFSASESQFKAAITTPLEIADVIRELNNLPSAYRATSVDYRPHVTLLLDLASDRLGVRVLFDGEAQTPLIFDGLSRTSYRALDNILLKILDESGSWDENQSLWYVNSSHQIEIILGLAQEYPEVFRFKDKARIAFAHELLDARLTISWRTGGAQLSMSWLLPNAETAAREGEILGTGPYWASVNNSIYRLSSSAAKIASIFPYSSNVTISRAQIGPILESLTSSLFDTHLVEIQNPELQPETKVKSPQAMLEIRRLESNMEHFASQEEFEIGAKLVFEYPTPPPEQNLVYLPDKEKEAECIDFLKSSGFDYVAQEKLYTLGGDRALDLAHKGSKAFPSKWKVSGLNELQKSIRFSDLNLTLRISTAQSDEKRQKGGSIDWFDCHIQLTQNRANVPISTIFKNQRKASDKWIRLDNGSYAQVPGGDIGHLKTTLGMLDANFRLSNTIKTKLSSAQALGLSRLDEVGLDLQIDRKLEELSEKLANFREIPNAKVSKHFKGQLRSYQEDGLRWLVFLRDFGLGGILADEMGLGKTVQALALLQNLKERKGAGRLSKPVLIVAPTSVITNWVYECKRFTPNLSVLLLHGPDRKSKFDEIKYHDIVVTSYALLRLDRYDLERQQFAYIILDEAQNIKNYQAAVTKAAKAIRAERRLALTGTPTENRPMELWSIMDFLMPGYLGSHDFFKNYIEKPILEAGPEVQIAKFLNSKTRPFILRRQKSEVEKDLPLKTESELHVPMTDSQSTLYAEVLAEVRPKVFEAVKARGIRGASVSILAALLRLRQICNHPNSIDALKELPGFDSGKFNALKELCEEALANGRKILLFSQFREMLAIIRRWLVEQKTEHVYLDGTTRDRQSLIDRFNNDDSVRLFLISLKAGGTGLNLTAADTVIIYDPWWNPAVEHQAVDRAHRIGQTKPVSVYRLVTENSIEQKIMELKRKKAKLVEALINENGLSTLSLSKTDLESLFNPLPVEE